MRRTIALVGLLLVAGAGLWWAFRDPGTSGGGARTSDGRPVAGGRSNPPRAGGPGEGAPGGRGAAGAVAPAESVPALDELRAALAAGDAGQIKVAASRLRLSLRLDDPVWAAVAALLRDPTVPADVRAAVAIVVGTVPRDDADAVLLRGLEVAGDAPDLVRAFLLAFGETREPPDDDDVFDLGDRPWGEVGPAAPGVTIRREIDDPAARAAIAGALGSPDAETRRVAAVSLRHSLDSADALAAFEGALAREADDVPASVLAESLVVQARRTREDEVRARLVRGVIARTDGETFDATRFRIVDDLQRVALPQDVVDSLIATLGPEVPFGRRVFALDVLAASAVESGAEVVTAVREQFVHLLETAADPAIRDACARNLRRLPADRSSSEALVRAVRGDAAWNVRYAALDTLADLKDEHLDLALDWAGKDDDARVRTRASEIASKR